MYIYIDICNIYIYIYIYIYIPTSVWQFTRILATRSLQSRNSVASTSAFPVNQSTSIASKARRTTAKPSTSSSTRHLISLFFAGHWANQNITILRQSTSAAICIPTATASRCFHGNGSNPSVEKVMQIDGSSSCLHGFDQNELIFCWSLIQDDFTLTNFATS